MKKTRFFAVLACLLFVFADLSAAALARADDLGAQCAGISDSSGCTSLSSAGCKALLQKCADFYDQQSAQLAKDLTKTTAQKNTLQNQINSLKKRIQGLTADINEGKIMVKDLNIQISDTQVSIDKTSRDISDSQKQLQAILQSVYEEDQKPSFVIFLSGNLSDFFGNLANLDNLNSEVGNLLNSTKTLKTYLAGQQIKMSDNVSQLQKTIALQTLQAQQSQEAQQEQSQYLKMTEVQFQQQQKDKLAADQASAKIKSMLFQVAGVTQAPTFGQALDIANSISQIIRIRPAFLLAVISQESALGRNVGKCLLTNASTGEGKKMSTGAYMPKVFKVSRDLQPFLAITASVGRDPLNSPISCDTFGSMGPAQFIPSTWSKFVDRLKSLLGHAADPWVIKDSFAASAMYLSDLGAGSDEATAAYHYNGSGNMARIYSRTVMTRATCIQTFIDSGTMSTSCQNMIF